MRATDIHAAPLNVSFTRWARRAPKFWPATGATENASATTGMNPAWMMRIPMPTPACAAAPKGRVIEYTRPRYTVVMPNSTPLGRPMPSMRFQTAVCGRQARGSNRRKEPTFRKNAVSHTSPTTMATSEASAAPATPSPTAGAPAEDEERREDHIEDDRRGSHHHAGLEVADGSQGCAHCHEAELERHGRDEPEEVLPRELGGARVGGHAAGVGEARHQPEHEEQGARHHRQHLRLVEQHHRLGRVFPADGV